MNNTDQSSLYAKKLDAYIHKTIKLTSKELYRKNSIHQNREVCILNKPLDDNGNDMASTLKDESSAVEDCVISKLSNDLSSNTSLKNVLEKLTDRQRLIIYLHYSNKMSLKEISNQIKVSAQAVSKAKISALNILKNAIKEK